MKESATFTSNFQDVLNNWKRHAAAQAVRFPVSNIYCDVDGIVLQPQHIDRHSKRLSLLPQGHETYTYHTILSSPDTQ